MSEPQTDTFGLQRPQNFPLADPQYAADSREPSTDETASDTTTEAIIGFANRLFTAARSGDEESYALILQTLDYSRGRVVDTRNEKGDTLVMLACYHGHAATARLLLEYGADPNILNERGQSPLAGAVFKNERACVIALLDHGADPEIGLPSALDCCRMFRQEEYLVMFMKQIEGLRGKRFTNGHLHVYNDTNRATEINRSNLNRNDDVVEDADRTNSEHNGDE